MGSFTSSAGSAVTAPSIAHDVYDPTTNTWTSRAVSPDAHHPRGRRGSTGGTIYVAGGYIGTSSTGTGYAQKFGVKDVWKYNVDTNQWTAFTALPRKSPAAGSCSSGASLHWISGKQQPAAGHRRPLRAQPRQAGATVADRRAAAVRPQPPRRRRDERQDLRQSAGSSATTSCSRRRSTCTSTTPRATRGHKLADLPTAISHIASATFEFGGRIVMAGGETAHNVPTDLVYAFDPVKNEWAAMTKLPAKRFSGVAAEIGGDIWFTTGSSQTTTWKGIVS
jgi:N-acetylneuraminic acid mutarotase